ncbi:hypothetical protein LXL04_020421 [Taraxacum kok-saghyz]
MKEKKKRKNYCELFLRRCRTSNTPTAPPPSFAYVVAFLVAGDASVTPASLQPLHTSLFHVQEYFGHIKTSVMVQAFHIKTSVISNFKLIKGNIKFKFGYTCLTPDRLSLSPSRLPPSLTDSGPFTDPSEQINRLKPPQPPPPAATGHHPKVAMGKLNLVTCVCVITCVVYLYDPKNVAVPCYSGSSGCCVESN